MQIFEVCLLSPPRPDYTMPIMWTIRECDCSCQWAAVVTVTLSGACLPFYLVGTWPLIFTPARLRSPCHRSHLMQIVRSEPLLDQENVCRSA